MKLKIEIPPATGVLDIKEAFLNFQYKKLKRHYLGDKRVCDVCNQDNNEKLFFNLCPVYAYDYEDQTQTLETMQCLCDLCVLAQKAGLLATNPDWFEHVMKLNEMSNRDLKKDISAAYELHESRSRLQWNFKLGSEIIEVLRDDESSGKI